MRDFLKSVFLEVDAHKEDGLVMDIMRPILTDLKHKITKEPTIFHHELHNIINTIEFFAGCKIPCLSEASKYLM
jgi:hypothetical protein